MKTYFVLCLLFATSLLAGENKSMTLAQYRHVVVEKVKTKLPKMRKCYQSQLDKQGHIKGKTITFILSIAKEGYLEQIHVAESYSMEVLRCVNSNLAGLQFPPPPQGRPLKMRLPLNFKINYK